MAIEVALPRQGWSMEEAVFVEWLKKDGDEVRAGDAVFSVETDKAVQEIESLDAGILRLAPNAPNAGDPVRVGNVLAYLVAAGEAAPFEKRGGAGEGRTTATGENIPEAKKPVAKSVAPVPAFAGERGPVTPAAAPEARAVSPRAARRAVQAGVDLRAVQGTGRGGRIREADILAALQGKPGLAAAATAPGAAAKRSVPGREISITPLRRMIAERMYRSKSVTAPVTLTTRVDAGALIRLREQFKSSARPSDDPIPSYSDMIIRLAALLLKEHPALNARWEENRMVWPDGINIGIAVDTEAGLLAPVVRDVPALSLSQLAAITRDLIARAQQRRLAAGEMTGGTFTVTNLGSFGVDAFTPIINHPECAVLGLGRIAHEPAVVADQVVVQDRMWLSLTFDHRIVDGAPAARFLDALRKLIENPAATLATAGSSGAAESKTGERTRNMQS